jgi:hypothetical protein
VATEAVFIARYVRGKLLLMVLICVVGVAVFGFIAMFPETFQPPSVLTRPAGVFGATIFSLLLFVNLRESARRGAVIIIGPAGLVWRRWSEEQVPWPALRAARFARNRGEDVVRLWLREPVRSRPRSLLERVAPVNRLLGAGDMELSTTGTDRSFQEMAEAVQTFAPHLLQGEIDRQAAVSRRRDKA